MWSSLRHCNRRSVVARSLVPYHQISSVLSFSSRDFSNSLTGADENSSEDDNDFANMNSKTMTATTTFFPDPSLLIAEKVPTAGEWAGCSRRFMAPLQISARGHDILTDPLFNKGTAFKTGERDRLRFRGLLPPRVLNMELQKERFLLALRGEASTIQKHLLLEDLHDRNETLYHRVLVRTIQQQTYQMLVYCILRTLNSLMSRWITWRKWHP
jgi:hypothetical protein